MDENEMGRYPISKQESEENYEKAGNLIPEDTEQITMETHQHLLSDSVHMIIQEVLEEHQLPYKLMDFQMITLHSLGNLQNVILLSPTGSGKMICAYLGILVLMKVFKIKHGVGLGTMPISALMEEKLKGPLIKTGLITMNGDLKSNIQENDAFLSDPIDQFKNGDTTIILGHPESWLTSTAQEITVSLSKQGLIVGSFLDEFQMNLADHWGSDFRPHMKTVPGQLRAKTVKGAPMLCMSATATLSEVEELKINLGLRPSNTVMLRADPVQTQFKYVRVERPANIYGSFGSESFEGDLKPGLIHIMNRLFFDQYVDKVKMGVTVKKSIWICRNEDDICDLYDALCERLPDQASDPLRCPFVMNHSGIGPITAESIRQRRGEINLYLTTSIMLLGLDFADVDVVGMVRPLNHCHYVVQAAGRGGRNMGNGMRKQVLFYLLYNRNDIGANVPGLSDKMREFCVTKKCLKIFLKEYFGFTSGTSSSADCAALIAKFNICFVFRL